MTDLYDVAREVTDEVMGPGTYAKLNADNPDPNIRRAAQQTDGFQSDEEKSNLWLERGKRMLTRAMEELESGSPDDGVLGSVQAAREALDAAWGEKPSPALEEFFEDMERDPEENCTCRADLKARGGWESSCPVHGRGS